MEVSIFSPTPLLTHLMSRAPCHPPFVPGHSDWQFDCIQSEWWTLCLSETMLRFCCSLNPVRGRNNVSAFSSCPVLCKQPPFLCRNISLTSFLDSANYCIPGEYITISKYCCCVAFVSSVTLQPYATGWNTYHLIIVLWHIPSSLANFLENMGTPLHI